MFCKYCGKQIDDRAVICPGCGIPTEHRAGGNELNTFAIMGFIFAFFIPLAGLILSIIGYRKAKETHSGQGFALAGIIIGAVAIALEFIFMIALFPLMLFA